LPITDITTRVYGRNYARPFCKSQSLVCDGPSLLFICLDFHKCVSIATKLGTHKVLLATPVSHIRGRPCKDGRLQAKKR